MLVTQLKNAMSLMGNEDNDMSKIMYVFLIVHDDILEGGWGKMCLLQVWKINSCRRH